MKKESQTNLATLHETLTAALKTRDENQDYYDSLTTLQNTVTNHLNQHEKTKKQLDRFGLFMALSWTIIFIIPFLSNEVLNIKRDLPNDYLPMTFLMATASFMVVSIFSAAKHHNKKTSIKLANNLDTRYIELKRNHLMKELDIKNGNRLELQTQESLDTSLENFVSSEFGFEHHH